MSFETLAYNIALLTSKEAIPFLIIALSVLLFLPKLKELRTALKKEEFRIADLASFLLSDDADIGVTCLRHRPAQVICITEHHVMVLYEAYGDKESLQIKLWGIERVSFTFIGGVLFEICLDERHYIEAEYHDTQERWQIGNFFLRTRKLIERRIPQEAAE